MHEPIPHLGDLSGVELSDEARREVLRNQRRRRAMDEREEPLLVSLLPVGVLVSIVVVAVGLASWQIDIIQTGLVALGGFCGGAALERRALFRRRG